MSVKQGYRVNGEENCTAKEYLLAYVNGGSVDERDLPSVLEWFNNLTHMQRPICGDSLCDKLQGYV